MRLTLISSLLAAVLGLMAVAPGASAETVLEQYQRTGKVDPCAARGGAGDIPNDVEQYAPDFLDAYRAAQRAGCDSGVSQTKPTETDEGVPVAGGRPLPPGTNFVPKPPAPPREAGRAAGPVRHQPLAVKGDTTTPAPIIVLAVMLLLALIGGALAATARYLGWGVDRLDPLRHTFAEARASASDGLSGLADRLRALARRGA